jgi:GntR family transcriptional regulator
MMRSSLLRQPLYAQIKSVLIQRIGEGEWQDGKALPSEWDLAAQLQASQGTIRRALTELVNDGVLLRRQGRGTFVVEVASDWGEGCLVSPGLFHETPDALALELLGCSHVNAAEDVALALGVRRGTTLLRVRQIWRLRGQVVALDDALLPAEAYDGLDARWLRQCGGGVYVALQRRFGVRARVLSQQLRAVLLPREEAGLLGVLPELPALSLLRLSATVEGAPVEWRQRWCLTHTLAYTVSQAASNNAM